MEDQIGAKFRNQFGPYSTLVQMSEAEDCTDQELLEFIKDPIHRQALDRMIELSKEYNLI